MSVKRMCMWSVGLVTSVAFSGAVFAQDEDGSLTDSLSEEELAAVEAESEVITVTGSAIERKELTTPAPVSVLAKEDLDAAGLTSIGDILQNLPEQSNAINAQFNNGGDGSTRISLRGLGAGRTLVLVNGRRHVPGGTGANSSVDLNSIPLAVIERVEVLKDGASAIYGSDAIGGVVNVITKKSFDGVDASAYTGTTGRGGGTIYDLSVVAGHKSKRGSILFAAGFQEQRPISAGQRDFSRSDKSYNWQTGEVSTNGSTSVPNGFINLQGDERAGAGNDAWNAVINAHPDAPTLYRDPESGWRPFAATGNSDVGEGDLYNYQPENYLMTPQRRYNVYSSGNYEMHDHVKAFFEASYTNRESDQKLAPTPLFTVSEGISVSGQSVYNPFGRDFVDVRRRMLEAGNRRFLQNVDTFRVVGGLEGDLPENISDTWRWNVAFNYGRTRASSINQGRFVLSRVEEALGPSYLDADGVAQCGTVDNPGSTGCVPLNLLGGQGTVTQDMIDYISYDGIAEGFTEQTSVVAQTNGRLFKTPWNGDMRVAVGGEWRDEAGGFQPDPITASGDTTGSKEEPTGGSYNVMAGFAELSFVPVSGKPGAKWVELSAAARAFKFSSFGADYTWKTGGMYSPGGGLSVRGTYSTAFRAPSIGQLFQGQQDDFPNVTDPCDTSKGPRGPIVDANCRMDGLPDDYRDDREQIRAQIGGNDQLNPETSKMLTAGVVYEPTFLEGMAITLDYFNLKIDNAIQPVSASVLLSNCYAQSDRTSCDAIERNSTGFITNIYDLQSNIGGNETAGLDFGVTYGYMSPIGRFRHNVDGTWLHKYDEIQPSRTVNGLGVYDLGVYPKLRANFATTWGMGPVGAGTNWRYIHRFKECEDNDCSADNMSRRVKANVTGDVFASYKLKSGLGESNITVGVNNVLDQDPAVIFNGFLGTSDASTYDFLGRFFYMRFNQRF